MRRLVRAVNLTGSPTIVNSKHVIRVHANAFLPADKNLIPTGELKPVAAAGAWTDAPPDISGRSGRSDPRGRSLPSSATRARPRA